jgi:hypothetical protein
MSGLCTWSALAAHLLAFAPPPTNMLPPGPADAEFVEADTQHEVPHPQIIPKRVRTIDIDPCPPPDTPCC